MIPYLLFYIVTIIAGIFIVRSKKVRLNAEKYLFLSWLTFGLLVIVALYFQFDGQNSGIFIANYFKSNLVEIFFINAILIFAFAVNNGPDNIAKQKIEPEIVNDISVANQQIEDILYPVTEIIVSKYKENSGLPILATQINQFTKVKFKASKIDWDKISNKNKIIGLAGEQFVVEYEKSSLKKAGKENLAFKVNHAAQTQGDGLGYDVLSYFSNGEPKFIEVKSTRENSLRVFSLTKNELIFLQANLSNSFIYLVSYAMTPKPYLVVKSAKDVLQDASVSPIEYRIFI